MGSELRLSAWATDEAAARAAFDAVFADFERLESLMSTWRPGSDVLRINAAAGVQPVHVAAEVREVLRQARQISEWTEGTFDVTFGALTDVWKFDHDQDNSIPSAAAIRARLPLIDYRQIEIDDRAGTVFLKRQGMKIHLGGIGKGYAVERAVDILRRAGLRDFMIQAGGDLYVGGRKDGRPWRLGIQDPRGAEGQDLRHRRPHRQHLQHVGRLRPLLHQGRRPLSPHPRSVDGPTARGCAAASPSPPPARCSPTRSPKACSSSDRRREWRWSRRFRTSKRSSSPRTTVCWCPRDCGIVSFCYRSRRMHPSARSPRSLSGPRPGGACPRTAHSSARRNAVPFAS